MWKDRRSGIERECTIAQKGWVRLICTNTKSCAAPPNTVVHCRQTHHRCENIGRHHRINAIVCVLVLSAHACHNGCCVCSLRVEGAAMVEVMGCRGCLGSVRDTYRTSYILNVHPPEDEHPMSVMILAISQYPVRNRKWWSSARSRPTTSKLRECNPENYALLVSVRT